MTLHGPTGKAGRASIKHLASPEAAGKEHDKLVKVQKAKGYKPA